MKKYTIHGRKYANEPTYPNWDSERTFPIFNVIEEVEINLEASSIDEAYKWMLFNLPDYAVGCSIFSEDKKSFRLNAVRGPAYYFLPNLEQKTIVEYELTRLEAREQKERA